MSRDPLPAVGSGKLRPGYPGRYCLKVMLWACQTVNGGHPRHRRAIRYLAARALDARIAVYMLGR